GMSSGSEECQERCGDDDGSGGGGAVAGERETNRGSSRLMGEVREARYGERRHFEPAESVADCSGCGAAIDRGGGRMVARIGRGRWIGDDIRGKSANDAIDFAERACGESAAGRGG